MGVGRAAAQSRKSKVGSQRRVGARSRSRKSCSEASKRVRPSYPISEHERQDKKRQEKTRRRVESSRCAERPSGRCTSCCGLPRARSRLEARVGRLSRGGRSFIRSSPESLIYRRGSLASDSHGGSASQSLGKRPDPKCVPQSEQRRSLGRDIYRRI